LNYGRHLGLRYLKREMGNMAGLATVEGAVFALIGLLLAFTISGALQRFDDRRQLVIQEANAASTAHDRLALFEGDVGRDLQNKLRDYVQARIDLYRMPHDYSLSKRTEFFSSGQEDKILSLKNNVWNAAVAACPEASFRPACTSGDLRHIVRSWPRRFATCWLWYGGCQIAQLDTHAHFCRHVNGRALHSDRHGISAAWAYSH